MGLRSSTLGDPAFFARHVKPARTTLLALAMVIATCETGWSLPTFTVSIDDLTGAPTVNVSALQSALTPPSPLIQPDSVGEYLHFILPTGVSSPSSFAFYSDLYLNVVGVGSTLSDRLLVTYPGADNGQHIDVRFTADPNSLTPPPGSINSVSVNATGGFQPLGTLFEYQFVARVDPPGVPEPATVLLLGCGIVGIAWRHRRKGQATRRRPT